MSGGPMWNWFGLSYSSYLVVPRTLLCGMPDDWQEKFATLLDECRDTYDSSKIEDNYDVKLRGEDGRFKKDPLANYRHPPALPYASKKGETVQIDLGRKVKCKITGYTGIATSRCVFINGCARITVQPPIDKDGKHPDAMWIDEPSLEYVGDEKIDLGPKNNHGGPSVRAESARSPF